MNVYFLGEKQYSLQVILTDINDKEIRSKRNFHLLFTYKFQVNTFIRPYLNVYLEHQSTIALSKRQLYQLFSVSYKTLA